MKRSPGQRINYEESSILFKKCMKEEETKTATDLMGMRICEGKESILAFPTL